VAQELLNDLDGQCDAVGAPSFPHFACVDKLFGAAVDVPASKYLPTAHLRDTTTVVL
jgi:hypothetical protein